MVCAVPDYKGQGSFFCCSNDDFRLTVKNKRHRRLLYLPPPQNSLDRKSLKRKLLKIVTKILKLAFHN